MARGSRGQTVTLRLPRHERRKLTLGVQSWIDGTAERAEKLVEEYAEKIWKEAKEQVPVDTGNLRSTIEIRLKKTVFAGIQARIGTDRTTYAIHVEYGTQKMRAQPYIRPAMRKYEGDFLRDLEDILDRNRV